MHRKTTTEQIELHKRLIREIGDELGEMRRLYRRFKEREWHRAAEDVLDVGRALIAERKAYKQELKELIEGNHELQN